MNFKLQVLYDLSPASSSRCPAFLSLSQGFVVEADPPGTLAKYFTVSQYFLLRSVPEQQRSGIAQQQQSEDSCFPARKGGQRYLR